jgi:hypothetical protein
VPSTSWKQHRFMEAVSHSPSFAAKAGIPQKVGADFSAADDAAGITGNKSAVRGRALAKVALHRKQS